MNNVSILRMAMVILGIALLMCLAGVIWLSVETPARAIPDVLVGTTGLIVGGILGVLAPNRSQP